MSEEKALYIYRRKKIPSDNNPLESIERTITTKTVLDDDIRIQLFNIIAAIADQCGGKIIIQEEYIIERKTDVLDFARHPTTKDLTITLYKAEEGEKT